MNRRNFIKNTLALQAYLTLHKTMLMANMKEMKTKNWVWIPVDIKASDDDWKRRFERLKNTNFDAVIPEVYNGRYAFFGSKRLRVKAEYLERLIPIAQSFDLELHAWMWVMPCMLPNILTEHPDWYMLNALGESAADKPAYVDYYKFLCPAKEEVQEFIEGTVKELTAYDMDGIHLDYVRYPDVILAKGLWDKYNIIQDKEYPQYDYCYCPTCRSKFRKKYGVDPLNLEDPAHHKAWLQFRYDQVTHLVNDRLIPLVHKSGKKASAAVFPNWENVRQQWSVWKLDAVMPMLYNRFYLEGADWIKEKTKTALHSLTYNTSLYSGLFVEKSGQLKEYIHSAFDGGAQGIVLFSLDALNKEHYAMLNKVLTGYR